jgi:hypothetical protein
VILKPHIYKRGGVWWCNCKHSNRTGPYRDLKSAIVAAETIWVF